MAKDRSKQAAQLAWAGRVGKAALVAPFLAALAIGPIAGAQSAYHDPATPAEIALKLILERDQDSGSVLDDLKGPARKGQMTHHGAEMLTPALIAALIRAERNAVKHDCGGHYVTGEMCGLDYDPIICGQDFIDRKFRTEHQDGRSADVSTLWADGMPEADYHLVQTRDGWRIDGIHCHAMKDGVDLVKTGFNMR